MINRHVLEVGDNGGICDVGWDDIGSVFSYIGLSPDTQCAVRQG